MKQQNHSFKKATTEIIAQYEGTTLTMLQKKKKAEIFFGFSQIKELIPIWLQ